MTFKMIHRVWHISHYVECHWAKCCQAKCHFTPKYSPSNDKVLTKVFWFIQKIRKICFNSSVQLFSWCRIHNTLMGLYHPLDVVTNLKYKLLHFLTLHNNISKRKALAFNRDRCCHLVICLRLILFHSFVTYEWNLWQPNFSMGTILGCLIGLVPFVLFYREGGVGYEPMPLKYFG